MTSRKEALDAERCQIEERLGYYMTQSRQAEMMRMAHKVTKLLADSSFAGCAMSYQEALMVLRMAESGIRTVLQWEDTR